MKLCVKKCDVKSVRFFSHSITHIQEFMSQKGAMEKFCRLKQDVA